jgi:hypothetical protein
MQEILFFSETLLHGFACQQSCSSRLLSDWLLYHRHLSVPWRQDEPYTIFNLIIIISLHSLFWNKHFCEELIALICFIRHAPHIKRRLQRFFYYCVCIRYRGNVFTQSLLSNGSGYIIYIQTDGWDLWSTPLRWAQVPWYTYQVS